MNTEPISRKLSHGIFYLLSSSLMTVVINAITVGFIARKLGVENFGLFSAITSFVGLFEFLSDFGLNKTLLKFGSANLEKTKTSFGNALFLKSILSIPSIILISFTGYLVGYRDKTLIVLILFSSSLVFDSFAVVFSSIRRILGNFKLISFFRVVKTILNLVIIYLALSTNNSVYSIAIANFLLSLITFTVSLINSILLLKPKLDLGLIREFIKDSIIFSFSDFFTNIYSKISTVLLSFMQDLYSVGIYSAAIKFTRIANLLPNQVRFAVLPSVYRIVEIQQAEHHLENPKNRVFKIMFKYMLILATPATILIYFFSSDVINIIFSRKYNSSIPLVELFSFFIYLRFIETPFTLFYIGLNKHKNMTYSQAISTVLNIILNFILIPKFSCIGACLATLISELLFSLQLILCGLNFSIWDIKNIFLVFLKPTISGILGLIIVLGFFTNINILIKVFLFCIVYLTCLFLLKTFDNEDNELMKKIFSRKILTSKS